MAQSRSIPGPSQQFYKRGGYKRVGINSDAHINGILLVVFII